MLGSGRKPLIIEGNSISGDLGASSSRGLGFQSLGVSGFWALALGSEGKPLVRASGPFNADDSMLAI